MRQALGVSVLLLAACAAGPGGEPAVHRTGALFPQDIGMVRGAAMSSLIRMGHWVVPVDSAGAQQRLNGVGEESEVQVQLRSRGGRSTEMDVTVLGDPEGETLERFVEGVEGVLR